MCRLFRTRCRACGSPYDVQECCMQWHHQQCSYREITPGPLPAQALLEVRCPFCNAAPYPPVPTLGASTHVTGAGMTSGGIVSAAPYPPVSTQGFLTHLTGAGGRIVSPGPNAPVSTLGYLPHLAGAGMAGGGIVSPGPYTPVSTQGFPAHLAGAGMAGGGIVSGSAQGIPAHGQGYYSGHGFGGALPNAVGTGFYGPTGNTA